MKQISCLREFSRYTFFGGLGTLGISCYILADTFFVSLGLGTSGLTALNLAIPVYNFIHGVGLMCNDNSSCIFNRNLSGCFDFHRINSIRFQQRKSPWTSRSRCFRYGAVLYIHSLCRFQYYLSCIFHLGGKCSSRSYSIGYARLYLNYSRSGHTLFYLGNYRGVACLSDN